MAKRNITYLLGAGASWHSLPLINEFVQSPDDSNSRPSYSLDFFLGALNDVQSIHPDVRFESELQLIKESTLEVKTGLMSGKHSTIDTWVKKTVIQGDTLMMQKIQSVTDLFLSSLEYLNGNDPRYETFFSNILSQYDKVLPENLKILSWNYDRQVQSALLRVARNKGLYRYNDKSFKDHDIRNFLYRDNFLKINGELSFYSDKLDQFRTQYYQEKVINLPKIIFEIISEQLNFRSHLRSNDIEYAWNYERIFNRFDSSKDIFDSEMLVVIGYSFPESNRKIDVNIFERMKGSLKKIIIQDKNPEAVLDKVKDVMEGAGMEYREDFVRLINNCDNFYIPNDLLY